MAKTPQEEEFDKAKKYAGDTRSRMRTIFAKIKEAAKNEDVKECEKLRNDFLAEAHKLPGIYSRMERGLEAFKKLVAAGVPPSVASKSALQPLGDGTDGFPEDKDFDPDKLKVVNANPGGTTGAKVVEIEGRKFMLKTVGMVKAEHVENEVAYNLAYREFGVWAKSGRVYKHNGKTYALMEYVEGAKPLADYLRTVDYAKAEEVKKELMKGFVLDALFANWDVVGTNKDNVMVTNDGKVIRIDNGSCGRFRAQGSAKKKEEWEERQTLDEIWSLRTSSINKGVFDGFTTGEIIETAANEMDSLERAIKRLPKDDQMAIEKPLEELKSLVAQYENLKKVGTEKKFMSLQLDGGHKLNKIDYSGCCPKAVSYCNYGFCRSGSGNANNIPSPPTPPAWNGAKYKDTILEAVKSVNYHIGQLDYKANNTKVNNAISLEQELKDNGSPEAMALVAVIKELKDSKVAGYKIKIGMMPNIVVPQNPIEAAKAQAKYQKDLADYNKKYSGKVKTTSFKSLTDMIFHAVKEAGGDPDMIANYQQAQGQNSWTGGGGTTCRLKALEMASRGDDIDIAVKKGMWDGAGYSKGLADAIKYYTNHPDEFEKDKKAFAVYKAAVVKFLETTDVPGRDLKTRSIFLIRTESTQAVIKKYNIPPMVMMDYPISACESFGCGKRTYAYGKYGYSTVLFRVPFENCVSPYFLENKPGAQNNMLGTSDGEQEMSADAYGVEFPKLYPADETLSFGEYLNLYDTEYEKWLKSGKKVVRCY